MPGEAGERHPSDGGLILDAADPAAFETWLEAHHADVAFVWLRFARKASGLPSITLPEAKEVSACFGWVDSRMYRWDEQHYVLRYQPRGRRARWSAGNCALAERLIAEGRMRPAGLAAVAAARADGRWTDVVR